MHVSTYAKCGTTCKRATIRSPFCLQHTRDLLGLNIKGSGIHGCGLFAERDILPGDVLTPYTGDFVHSSDHTERYFHPLYICAEL